MQTTLIQKFFFLLGSLTNFIAAIILAISTYREYSRNGKNTIDTWQGYLFLLFSIIHLIVSMLFTLLLLYYTFM